MTISFPAGLARGAVLELQRQNGLPKWVSHTIDDDSGVGTQFEVADVNDDGLLDINILHKLGRKRLLSIFPKLFKGTHINEPEVQYIKGKKRNYYNADTRYCCTGSERNE